MLLWPRNTSRLNTTEVGSANEDPRTSLGLDVAGAGEIITSVANAGSSNITSVSRSRDVVTVLCAKCQRSCEQHGQATYCKG